MVVYVRVCVYEGVSKNLCVCVCGVIRDKIVIDRYSECVSVLPYDTP